MSVNIFLATLEEYLKIKKDFKNAHDNEKALLAAIKRFAHAFNAYIDWRTDGVLEERGKRISTGRDLNIAELLTSNAEIPVSVVALNAAPSPPEKLPDEQWVAAYNDWYNIIRKKGLASK